MRRGGAADPIVPVGAIAIGSRGSPAPPHEPRPSRPPEGLPFFFKPFPNLYSF